MYGETRAPFREFSIFPRREIVARHLSLHKMIGCLFPIWPVVYDLY